MNRLAPLLLATPFALIVLLQGVTPLVAQRSEDSEAALELRQQLDVARAQQRSARLRAERLEQETQRAEEVGGTAQREAAALAARVQQAEARVAGAHAELALVAQERRALSRDLAERRAPLAGLTAALETMTRRPPALSWLQSGSLRDVVYTRATLAAALPDVERRTAGLQSQLGRVQETEAAMRARLAERREAEQTVSERRRDLLALAETQRIRAAQTTSAASREALRASELARKASDLDALVAGLSSAGATAPSTAGQSGFLAPVDGALVARFGNGRPGVTYRPATGAVVVAPAGGEVAFAGPYDGYGTIVIVKHTGGRTSLVTGLANTLVATGQDITAGFPLGRASTMRPEIGWELRQGRRAIDPLALLD